MREMKDSGIDWIGDIPANWNVLKNKFIFNFHKDIVGNKVESYERLSLTMNGVLKRSKDDNEGLQPIDFVGYQILKQGDLVFKLIDLQNTSTSRVGFSPFTGLVSPAYICLTPTNFINPSYAELYFLSMWYRNIFNHLGDSGVRSSLNATELLEIPITIPSIAEQARIASFLDSKCAEIDSITADIQKEIELLQEYRKSVITEAVTKGLDPDVEMKDSGVEWIGMIPKHWDINKGKNCLNLLLKPVRKEDDVITCFRDGEVTLRSKRREDGFTVSLQEIGYQGIDIGDLIVHGMDGFAGAIGISDSRGKASPVLNVIDTKNNNKRYIMYYLRSMAYNGVFIALATGIRVRTCDTNWSKLRELPYTIPSRQEQNCIAFFLDSKCAEIDFIIEAKQKQLDTIAEYRKSLIYEYVTGKKEVPTV